MNLANMAGRQQWHHTVALTEAQLIHCGQWGATAAPLWGPCVVVPKDTVGLGVQHACAGILEPNMMVYGAFEASEQTRAPGHHAR